MTTRKRDILLWSLAIVISMAAITFYFRGDRLAFYLNTKDIPSSPLGNYDADSDTPVTPNVDLGFISFHLELSPEATVKKSESTITVKDQGRTLVINLPEIFEEM